MKARLLLALGFFFVAVTVSQAHELRPGYLELRETQPETFDVIWKVPAKGDPLSAESQGYPGCNRAERLLPYWL